MNISVALVFGAASIAAAIAISHRYEIIGYRCNVTSDLCSHSWVIDQWTGRVLLCEYAPAPPRSITPACIKAIGDSP